MRAVSHYPGPAYCQHSFPCSEHAGERNIQRTAPAAGLDGRSAEADDQPEGEFRKRTRLSCFWWLSHDHCCFVVLSMAAVLSVLLCCIYATGPGANLSDTPTCLSQRYTHKYRHLHISMFLLVSFDLCCLTQMLRGKDTLQACFQCCVCVNPCLFVCFI